MDGMMVLVLWGLGVLIAVGYVWWRRRHSQVQGSSYASWMVWGLLTWPLMVMVGLTVLPAALIALVLWVLGRVVPPLVAGMMEPLDAYWNKSEEQTSVKNERRGYVPYFDSKERQWKNFD